MQLAPACHRRSPSGRSAGHRPAPGGWCLQLPATAGVGADLEAATQRGLQTRSRRIRCTGTSRLDIPCASRRSWPTSAAIWNWRSSAAAMSCGSDRPADPSPVRFRPLPPSRPRFWRQVASRTSSRSGSRCEPQAPLFARHQHLHLPDEEPAPNGGDALDKLIAAHALALDITLVTNNPRDFIPYAGLRIENWVD